MDSKPSDLGEVALGCLKHFGRGIWTFPEILLGPKNPIVICWRADFMIRWCEREKKDFPTQVWEDGASSKQLVENYDNTSLTPLEFTKIAMGCLMSRQNAHGGGVNMHFPGDLSYVLMGFLRIRPPINQFDSSLQAFARYAFYPTIRFWKRAGNFIKQESH